MRANAPRREPLQDAAKRASLKMAAGAFAGLILPLSVGAKETQPTFDQWIAAFQSKALARGITPETYARVMNGLKPDNTGLAAIHEQPEFNEQLWQYLNRRVSDWRIIAGRQKAQEYAALLARIERDYGVAPSVMLGVWGVESTFGDPLVQKNHMRPVDPVAGDARLGRAAPAHILGVRADQCAHRHSEWLEHARRDERLLGRRHGPYPVDAGGLVASRRRL